LSEGIFKTQTNHLLFVYTNTAYKVLNVAFMGTPSGTFEALTDFFS